MIIHLKTKKEKGIIMYNTAQMKTDSTKRFTIQDTIKDHQQKKRMILII